jgi:hypothetical protein
MSQFMNKAKRIKGWGDVERKLEEWISQFDKDNRTAHIRFLENLYQSKKGNPLRPVTENINNELKSAICEHTITHPNPGVLLIAQPFDVHGWSSFEICKIFPE